MKQIIKSTISENVRTHFIDVLFDFIPESITEPVDASIQSENSYIDSALKPGCPVVHHPKSTAVSKMSDSVLEDYNGFINDVYRMITEYFSNKGIHYLGHKTETNSYSCYMDITTDELDATDIWIIRFRISDHKGSMPRVKLDRKPFGLRILRNISIGKDQEFDNTVLAFVAIDQILKGLINNDVAVITRDYSQF